MPLGHIGLNVPDLARAREYFDDLMPLVGYEPFFAADDQFSYQPLDAKPGTRIFFYGSESAGDYSRSRTGLQHLAFIVKTRAAVETVHAWTVARGDTVVYA